MLIPCAALAEARFATPAFEGPLSRVLVQVVLQRINIYELHTAFRTPHYLVVPVRFLVQITFLEHKWLFNHF